MSQVKVFVTDRRTDEWVLMSPAFAKGGGQQNDGTDCLTDSSIFIGGGLKPTSI